MGLLEKFKNGLKKTAQQLTDNLDSLLKGPVKLSEATLDQMEESLVACDMGAETAQAIVREVEEAMKKEREADSGLLVRHLREAVFKRLLKTDSVWRLPNPAVILFARAHSAWS